jgi:hypothetical protein
MFSPTLFRIFGCLRVLHACVQPPLLKKRQKKDVVCFVVKEVLAKPKQKTKTIHVYCRRKSPFALLP